VNVCIFTIIIRIVSYRIVSKITISSPFVSIGLRIVSCDDRLVSSVVKILRMAIISTLVVSNLVQYGTFLHKMATKKTQEQVIAGFQELRMQQRNLANKVSEVEMDMKEHE